MKILSVDFDKTLTSASDRYPEVGVQKLIHKIVTLYVKRLQKRGWILILNTLRENGKGLLEAKKFCYSIGLEFDFYNENAPSLVETWGNSRKISCTRSIDDTQVGLIGWLLRKFG